MKRCLLVFLALMLTFTCFVSLLGCNQNAPDQKNADRTDRAGTNVVSKNGDAKQTGSQTRTEKSICFVGDDVTAPETVFFDSLDDAVAANPDGAVIKLCQGDALTVEGPFHFPKTGVFVLDFGNRELNITFDEGYVLECKVKGLSKMQYTYCNNLDYLMKANADNLQRACESGNKTTAPAYVPYLWVFGKTQDMEVGRYAIRPDRSNETDAAPSFRYERAEDLKNWGVPYVAICDGLYYTDLQDAINNAKPAGDNGIHISVIADCKANNEEKTFILPDNNYNYRIAYNYQIVDGKFNKGVTFDDGIGGYCYFSSVEYLSESDLEENSTVWMWDSVGKFEVGKYRLTAKPASWKASDNLSRPDSSKLYVFGTGNYIFSRVTDNNTNTDDFITAMKNYPDNVKEKD